MSNTPNDQASTVSYNKGSQDDGGVLLDELSTAVEKVVGQSDGDQPDDNAKEGCRLELGFRTYSIRELTQYGFVTGDPLPEEDPGHVFHGKMHSNDASPMEIEFRVRRYEGNSAKCTFCNLSLKQKKVLLKLLDTMSRSGIEEDAITSLSYDQLASGTAIAEVVEEEGKADTKNSVKTFAVLALGLGMLAILGLSAAFMHMQYSLAVSNAALVGNYLPINTKIDGQIAEVFFSEGDEVVQGDLLLRLTNPVLESAAAMSKAELAAAETKVQALQHQVDGFQVMLNIVSGRLDLELEETRSELRQSQKNLDIANAEVKRFTPYVKSGVIAQVDFDESVSTQLAWKADCAAKRAKIKMVKLSMQAAKKNILVMGDRIDAPQSKLLADLKVAEADVLRLQVELDQTEQQAKQLEIVAPRDGEIYASYRQVGEYLKPAEEALAISYPGRTWAMGQISASQVSKVRRGQVVSVSIPSLGIKTKGTVATVGHRAVYAKGGYTADFRSGVATDVPIKVMLDDLPEDVLSGTRLDMVVKLEIGIPWLDNYLGNTPRRVLDIPLPLMPTPAPVETSSTSGPLVSKAAL